MKEENKTKFKLTIREYINGNWSEIIIDKNLHDEELAKELFGSESVIEKFYDSDEFVEYHFPRIIIWKEETYYSDEYNNIPTRFLVHLDDDWSWFEYIIVRGGLPSLLSFLRELEKLTNLFKNKTYKK